MTNALSSANPTHSPEQSEGRGLAQGRAGVPLIPQDESTKWLENFISPQTKQSYQVAIRSFVDFANLQSMEDLQAVDGGHVIAWRNDMLSSGMKPRSVQARMSALSSLMNALTEAQLVKLNPVKGIKRPKVDASRVVTPILTPQQVRAMIDEAQAEKRENKRLRNTAILSTLFYTGCRVSECANLRVGDYFEDQGYAHLEFTVKGGKQNRLAIHQELQNALEVYLRHQGHENAEKAPMFQPLAQELGTFQVKPLGRHQIEEVFNLYAKRAGVPKQASCHSARATFVTESLNNGSAIEAVQRTVGHASITTTQTYDKRSYKPRDSASFAVRY